MVVLSTPRSKAFTQKVLGKKTVAVAQRTGANPNRLGATAVEFALVAPILFALVLGIIEVGRGFMVIHLLNGAARQGCRAAVIPGSTTTNIQTQVNTALANQGVSGTITTVKVNGSSQTDASAAGTGDTVTVQTTVSVSNFTWLPGGSFLSGNLGAAYTLDHE
jgi:Flp pilus assembly protein TadG